MHKTAFTTVTFRELSREDICRLAVKNKITNIEWGGDVHLPPNDVNALDEVIKLQKQYKLTAVSYGSYYRLGEKSYDLWNSITDTASAVGASVIRIWAGSKSSADTDEAELNSMVEEARALADTAALKNLTVAFEFHNNTYNDNGECSLRLLRAIDRSNVKTYWQPFSTEADMLNLKSVLPYLAGVHVFQWNKYGKRYALKRGRKKWMEYISVIRDAGLTVNYIMEFVKNDSPKRFARDAETLREILNKVYA